MTTAGENGFYTVSGVAAGTYNITATLGDQEAADTITVPDYIEKNLQLAAKTVPSGYTVSGTVSTNEGSPAGAQVQLRQGSSPVAGKTASAGADGTYTISGVAGGNYTIEVHLTGYDTGTTPIFTVSGNVAGKDITLTKTVILPNSHTVSGTVSINGGGSAEGASVQLRQNETPVGSAASADGSGAYTINGVVAGTYTIEVTLAGYDTGTIAAFEVSNANVTGKDIQLTKTVYTVSGTVSVNDSGSGGSTNGAQVQLNQSGSTVGSAVSAGSDGAYTISGVAPGTYTIEVSLAGYNTSTIDSFEVSNANVTGKDIQLTKTVYTVSGTVSVSDSGNSGSPNGTQVQLKQSGNHVGSAVYADGSGAYTITNVLPGSYTIEVSLAGYNTGTISSFEVSIDNVTGKDIQLTKTVIPPNSHTVSGTVSVSDSGNGGSPNGASVQLKKDNEAVGGVASADGSGAYTINGVVAGTYTIEVTLAGYNTGTITNVEVSNANVTGKDIQLTKTVYTVSGTVSVNGSGGSPNGASVQLKKDNATVGDAVYADGSGAYTITNVLPGSYTIEVSLTGYTTGTITAFEVSNGNITGKNIQLIKTVYTVKGTVSVNDGGSPNGAQVQLKQSGNHVGSAVYADGSGAYTISGVAPGTYTIEVSLDGYTTGTITEVEVSNANVTGKDIQLTKTVYTVSGTVSVNDSGGSPNGASVQLKKDNATVGSAVSAASNGQYTITNVLPGTYTIEVTLAGYTSGTITNVEVSNANVTGKDITLQKTVVSVTGVSLNKTTLSLTADGTETLTATVTPNNATNKNISWSSNNTAVATVNGGLVTAVGAGSATITVTTADGGKTASCEVTVAAAEAPEETYDETITGKTIAAALDEIKENGQSNKSYLIKLGQDETGIAGYSASGFSTPVSITIDGGGHTVNWVTSYENSNGLGCLYMYQSDLTIILKNGTFTGTTTDTGSLVYVDNGATFKMQAGAKLTGNRATSGGAVRVGKKGNSGSRFEMEGGEISGNVASQYGAGVYIESKGTMVMSGGSIKNNTQYSNSDIMLGVTLGASDASLIMSGSARIDRIWFQSNDSAVITIADNFTDIDTVATLENRKSTVGTQLLKSSNYTVLGNSVGRFVYAGTRSSPTGSVTASTLIIDSDGKLQNP